MKFETRSGISTGLEVLESNLAHDSFYPLPLSLFFFVVLSGLAMGMSSSNYVSKPCIYPKIVLDIIFGHESIASQDVHEQGT